MAEEEVPYRPFLAMWDIVDDYRHVDHEDGWEKLNCRRWEAYGCGDHGDLIVNGLTLFVRADPKFEDNQDFRPSMSIRVTPDVLSCIGLQIPEDMAEIYGRRIHISAHIYTIAGDVMVLCLSFLGRHDPSVFKSYYLVYDSSAPALFLLPRRPRNCQAICTTYPLKVGGEDKYSLVLMAEKVVPSPFRCTQAVLLMWSPPPPSNGNRWNSAMDKKIDSTSAWTLKYRARENAEDFRASVVFEWKGKAVWGDLGQGILYCDCSDLIDGPGPVDFKCIMLPSEFRDTDYMDQVPKHVYRNMGCVGDSIWFAIIEISDPNFGQTLVKVWTLDQLSEEGKWKPHREFNMKAIWELDDFREKKLPPSIPKYPMFRQKDDGVLYMLTPDFSIASVHAYLLGIDLSSSCGVPRLVVHRRMSIPWMERFFFLDTDFFSGRTIAV